MKLLFDENLSPHLIGKLIDLFPDSRHVASVGMSAVDDDVLWDFALKNGMTIVSKDSDFHQRSFLLGAPPKIIWIRKGNCSTGEIESVIRGNFKVIEKFHLDRDASFLVLS